MIPQVAIAVSCEQDHIQILSIIDRLLEIGVNFSGFSENCVPERFTPELLNSKLLFMDRGILAQMSEKEIKLLEEYSKSHIVSCIDYGGAGENRTVANFNAEISVNGALSGSGVIPGDVPEQSAEKTCRFAKERAAAFLKNTDLPFSEFTLHHLRALSGDNEVLCQYLPSLFDSQDPEKVPPHHDALGPWLYAPLCARLTGDKKYNRKFLQLLNNTMKARAWSESGIMGAAGNCADRLNLKGEFPLYEPHCVRRKETIYNEMFHFHGPVFAAAALASGDMSYLDYAMKLLRHLKTYNVDPADGLPCHFSDGTQRGGMKWSRGIAHILHGITLMFEVWHDMPVETAQELIAFADSIGDGLLRCQHESGLWHNVADEVTTPLESSATMAFISTYQALVNEGFLSESKYGEMLSRARKGFLKRCYRGGFAGNCSGTGLSIWQEYYFRRPFNFLFSGQIVSALDENVRFIR